MTAYQIGYLVGTVTGAIIGAAIAYKLFRSPKKLNRLLGVLVGALALSFAANGVLKHVFGDRRQDFEVGFRESCVRECALSASQSSCATFCECQLSKLLGGPDADRVIQEFRNAGTQADIAPEQQARLQGIAAECMPPEIYDANFMKMCTATCSEPGCPEQCRCYLDKVREGMDPATGTRWMMRNLDSDPITLEGEERLSAAETACNSAAPSK